MQKLSDEMLIKSLSLNVFYPREIAPLSPSEAAALGSRNQAAVLFSSLSDDARICRCSKDLDEIGYLRRYSSQRLFYLCERLSERAVLEASVYGADGLIYAQAAAVAEQMALGAGMTLAQDFRGRSLGALAALKSRARIIITEGALSGERLRGEML